MLKQKIKDLETQEEAIPQKRKKILEDLARSIASQLMQTQQSKVTFVCTHNSRRSQLAEIWLRAAAHHEGLEGISTFSGGTEATSFNPRMVQALQRAGFSTDTNGEEEENPIYTANLSNDDEPVQMFSKKYTDPHNPQLDFIAVMVCTQADEACPLVPGARDRISLPYVDPKRADDTLQEVETYDQTVDEIGREMLFVARRIKEMLEIS